MTKKNKNIVLVLVGIFFISLALLISENSSKILSIPEDVEKEAGEIFSDEIQFGSKTDEINEEYDEDNVESESDESQLSTNTYRVIKVVDGDTIDVVINGKEERLRLIGIDTPETKDPRKSVECFGNEASEKTREMLFGKNVSLEADETQSERDRYGRLLRYVFLEDGTNFNLFMIQEGYANEYTFDSAYKYQNEFKIAENEARKSEKGLWGKVCNP